MYQFPVAALTKQVKTVAACKQLPGTVFTAVVDPAYNESCLQAADEALVAPIASLPLSQYLLFSRKGNRSVYEAGFFARRDQLLQLFLGELASNRSGKYLDKLMDVIWAVLDESTWVLPAHGLSPTGQHVPYEWETVRSLDLFAATTAADLALVSWFLEEQFEEAVPVYFMERLRREVYRRVTEPFLTDEASPFMQWKGTDGNYVNNWNPWIVCSCLTVGLLLERDEARRRKMVEKSAAYVNNFMRFMPEDGSCPEMTAYFFYSNATVLDIAQMLEDITGGALSLMKEPFMKQMAESICWFYAGRGQYFTIADCGNGKVSQLSYLQRMGCLLDSQVLKDFVQRASGGQTIQEDLCNSHAPYRCMMNFAKPPVKHKQREYLPLPAVQYLPYHQIMIARQGNCMLAAKGGHNHEPHGHNDTGEFLIYYKEYPLFVDPGVETYSAKTFSNQRFAIWTMRSDWHNTPGFNGTVQQAGPQALDIEKQYTARNVQWNKSERRLTMELKDLYPASAGLQSAVRTMAMTPNGEIIIADQVQLEKSGVYNNYLVVTVKPQQQKNQLLFRLAGGCMVCEYPPDCTVQIEEQPLADALIRSAWEQDVLYRITLTKPMQQGECVLRIYEM